MNRRAVEVEAHRVKKFQDRRIWGRLHGEASCEPVSIGELKNLLSLAEAGASEEPVRTARVYLSDTRQPAQEPARPQEQLCSVETTTALPSRHRA